jgi:hypothetical protein
MNCTAPEPTLPTMTRGRPSCPRRRRQVGNSPPGPEAGVGAMAERA